jgi:uncharacterized membrane protein YcaP (DUF421 family)
VATVFTLHHSLAHACRHSHRFRCFVRGRPTQLVVNGELSHRALREEGLTVDELMAGLRKAGVESVGQVKAAYLEETGQISAIRREEAV